MYWLLLVCAMCGAGFNLFFAAIDWFKGVQDAEAIKLKKMSKYFHWCMMHVVAAIICIFFAAGAAQVLGI